MKKRHVNLGKSDENIAEQYTDIYEGLQKDAAQNSWDARATNKGKDWKLIFKYIHDRNILTMEDFGTRGMNEKEWNAYQNLWDTMKADEVGALGTRGQGKFLFHYFATDKLVLTESIDEEGNYRFSYGTSEEWDIDKNLQCFIPGAKQLDHQGTRIWIVNVREEFRDSLLDYRKFMRYITATWWEIIRNWNATFIVDFNGVARQVSLPEMPSIKKEKPFKDEKIKDLGKVRNLILRYCKEEVPEDLRGIAVQRGGMTILRFPIKAEEAIKNKIYGYCDFDEDLELELKQIELPNHFGFRDWRAWNHVKDFIEKKTLEFVDEISPRKKKGIVIDQKLLSEAIRLINNLVNEYAPELVDKGTGSGKLQKDTNQPVSPLPPVRIDTFHGNARKFEYNESLVSKCSLINETKEDRDLAVKVTIELADGDSIYSSERRINLFSNTRCNIDIPLIDFIEGRDKPGKYRASAILKDRPSDEEIHRRTFIFYVHQEPPETGKAFIRDIDPIYGRGLPFEKCKQLELSDKGILHIIWDHPDCEHIKNLSVLKKAKRRELFLYSVKCGIDESVRKLLTLRTNDNEITSEEISRIKTMADSMYYDAVERIFE